MFDARAFYCYKYFGSATMFLVHKMIEFSSKNERKKFIKNLNVRDFAEILTSY